MVEIYRALRAFLLADATIAATVGTRIYPMKLPQNVTYPAITILRVSGVRANVLRGSASLARPRYQIDCWVRETTGATAFTTAQDLGAAVFARMDSAHDGVIMTDPSTSPPTHYRATVTFDDDRDLFDPDVNGGYFRHSADYFVWYGVHPVAV